ncbi:MAG: Rieske (2Fe-2S) protein [Myxococcales bacterium]|nr:Rieske (2Fe-2S) protein [Myxococcales bacterium]
MNESTSIARKQARTALGRRRFIALTGAAAVCLPVLGCVEQDIDRLLEDVSIELADYPALERVGETVLVELDQLERPLAITRADAEEDRFLVTGTKCNHRGCGVEREGDGWVCPCHGAEFALDGELLKGPATAGLGAYEYEVADGVLTIFAGA